MTDKEEKQRLKEDKKREKEEKKREKEAKKKMSKIERKYEKDQKKMLKAEQKELELIASHESLMAEPPPPILKSSERVIYLLTMPANGHLNPLFCFLNTLLTKLDEIQVKKVVVYCGPAFKDTFLHLPNNEGRDLIEYRDYNLGRKAGSDDLLKLIMNFNTKPSGSQGGDVFRMFKCFENGVTLGTKHIFNGLLADMYREKPVLVLYDQALFFPKLALQVYVKKYPGVRMPLSACYITTFMCARGIYPTLRELQYLGVTTSCRNQCITACDFLRYCCVYYKTLWWNLGFSFWRIFTKMSAPVSQTYLIDEKFNVVFVLPEIQPLLERFKAPHIKFVGPCIDEKVRASIVARKFANLEKYSLMIDDYVDSIAINRLESSAQHNQLKRLFQALKLGPEDEQQQPTFAAASVAVTPTTPGKQLSSILEDNQFSLDTLEEKPQDEEAAAAAEDKRHTQDSLKIDEILPVPAAVSSTSINSSGTETSSVVTTTPTPVAVTRRKRPNGPKYLRLNSTGERFKLEHLPIIYISMGTVFNNENSDLFETLVRACKEFSQSYAIIVSTGDVKTYEKYENHELSKGGNILFVPHTPQIEILKRSHLFITHAGMNSVSEAIHYGVPIICLPLSGDQPFVALRVATDLGMGITLQPDKTLTVERVKESVREVLENPKYRAEALRLSRISKEREGHIDGVQELLAYVKENDPFFRMSRRQSSSSSSAEDANAVLKKKQAKK